MVVLVPDFISTGEGRYIQNVAPFLNWEKANKYLQDLMRVDSQSKVFRKYSLHTLNVIE